MKLARTAFSALLLAAFAACGGSKPAPGTPAAAPATAPADADAAPPPPPEEPATQAAPPAPDTNAESTDAEDPSGKKDQADEKVIDKKKANGAVDDM